MSRLAVRSLVPALAVLASATSAWAQDYAITEVHDQYVTVPGTATTFFNSSQDDVAANLSLPFTFTYFGKDYTSISICGNGFIQFGSQQSSAFGNEPLNNLSTSADGICAPYWDDIISDASTGSVKHFTTGTAPNRRFIVAWVNQVLYPESPAGGGTAVQFFSFQVHLWEGTGRIVFAYEAGSLFSAASSYTLGIDAVFPDSRFFTPPEVSFSNPAANVGEPPYDVQFDPRITTYSGRLLIDRPVVNATGIGNSTEQNVPLAGVLVQLRQAPSTVVGSGYCDAAGNFSFNCSALVGTTTGSLVAVAETRAGRVKPTAAGSVYSTTIAPSVSFASNAALGNVVYNAGNDASGAIRAPFNIARNLFSVYDWSAPRTVVTIPFIDVLYDPANVNATTYTKAAVPVAATMRIAGAANANPDQWDNDVIRKVYSRHVLANIAAAPSSFYDPVFDKTTDDQNAFAEGFAYYLNAVVSQTPNFFDGVNSTTAAAINLENPTITVPKSTSAAAWVASALYDLADASNEAWDTYDGTGVGAERAFKAADAFTGTPLASSFFTTWAAQGFDSASLSTLYIKNGLVADDADESNDTAATATNVAVFGFNRTARILNLFNEDWYQFTLAQQTNVLTAQLTYDRSLAATVALELRSGAGTLIATGAPQTTFGPIIATSGSLPPGVYRIRIVHGGGVPVPTYSIQAFPELAISSGEFAPWTAGHQYNVPVNVKGGIPPYALTVEAPFVKPPGLVLDGVNGVVTGTPTTPGTYDFSLTARDSANPNNLASGPIHFVVAPELTFTDAPFTAFVMGKAVDRDAPYTGGTAPLTTSVSEGSLPAGLALVNNQLHFTGTPTVGGSTAFKLTGTDVAGSTDTLTSKCVVCIPFGVSPLAAGDSACGFWFDAVKGSSVKIGIKTSAKRAKRPLTMTIVDSDGTTVIPSAAKPGTGKASLSGFIAPHTGRFFCIVASATGDETELAASVAIAPSKKGAGGSIDTNFGTGKTVNVEVGALAGAVLVVSGKPDKSGLLLRAVSITDPNGVTTPVATGEVVQKGGAFTFTKTLPISGTWKFVIGAQAGPQGGFKYTYKLAQPKGAVFSLP